MRRLLAGALLLMVVGACLPEQPADNTATVTGRLLAGPTCPVETNPPDPECALQTVPDAGIVVTLEDGDEIMARSDQNGRFRIFLPPGAFTIKFDSVDGMMSAPEPITANVQASQELDLADLSYDTGIR